MYENEVSIDCCRNLVLKSKTDEVKFFQKEYNSIDKDEDYYYIIPFKWIVLWDNYITDK